MGNLLEYSGIVTKVRAMEARLLTPDQLAASLRSPNISGRTRPMPTRWIR